MCELVKVIMCETTRKVEKSSQVEDKTAQTNLRINHLWKLPTGEYSGKAVHLQLYTSNFWIVPLNQSNPHNYELLNGYFDEQEKNIFT